MDFAYLSEFVGDETVFRAISSGAQTAPVQPGDSMPLDQVYCTHIIEGALPKVIRDTSEEPIALSLPITSQLPIGSHVSVPIRRSDGSIYRMFCCLSRTPNPSLTERDLAVLELFAEISGDEVNRSLLHRSRREKIAERTRAAIDGRGFRILWQPICDLATRRPVGFEALCRFAGTPYRSPDIWFAEAAELNLQTDLEVVVAVQALETLPLLPAGTYLSVNVSPSTAGSKALAAVLSAVNLRRVLLEVTEHDAMIDFAAVGYSLGGLRAQGLRLAVDDAGAGYSGLQQILRLRPDAIKLDMSLTRNIDGDPARRALAAAMQGFATQTGAVLIAEGIETEAELEVLADLGLRRGQGYLLGRPRPPEEHAAPPCALMSPTQALALG